MTLTYTAGMIFGPTTVSLKGLEVFIKSISEEEIATKTVNAHSGFINQESPVKEIEFLNNEVRFMSPCGFKLYIHGVDGGSLRVNDKIITVNFNPKFADHTHYVDYHIKLKGHELDNQELTVSSQMDFFQHFIIDTDPRR